MNETICCGDVVGYGADPNAVTEWVRANCLLTIRGNHDRACSGLENLEWFNPVARKVSCMSWSSITILVRTVCPPSILDTHPSARMCMPHSRSPNTCLARTHAGGPRGTAVALEADVRQEVDIRFLDSHEPMAVGDLEIHPYPVPHDAREPVQFTFADGARKLGVLTDAGSVTTHMVAMLAGCSALVLECNHDPELLAASRYPTFLKQRVGGRYGHLANATAAGLLAQLEQGKLQHVVAAHLSQENNRPSLATAALAGAMNCDPGWIGVADQEAGFDWRHIA